jgi:Cd2+/Zn2+-exporting ATPase
MKEQRMTEQTFRVTGMDCASCARSIETAVSQLPRVQSATLNFTTELLKVRGDANREAVIKRVQEIGYDVSEQLSVNGDRLSVNGDPSPISQSPNFLAYLWQRPSTRLTLLAALLILPGLLFHELLPGLGLHHPLLDVASVLAMVLAGYPVAMSAWRSLIVNRDININVLMTIAAVGAVFIGAYTEAGVVMVLFALGEALEGYTAAKSRDAIRSLMAVAPSDALRIGPDGREERIPVVELRLDDQILVKPGERIPMDGRITSGSSSVNQAPITGESKLVEKGAGDEVFASSINGEGALTITVTHLAEDNTISRLIKMVEEAQEKRSPTQRFVDQFARYYTPAVVVLALLVAVVPPLLFGAPGREWLYRALALLVVACPCALVISTPVSIISAISNAARNGVLFKGGAYLEALSRVRAMAFDKTGTLTQGTPAVVAVRSALCAVNEPCPACDDLVALASAVEQRSEHPLAQAIMQESARRGVAHEYLPAEQVRAIAGRGVQGEVNGRQVTIGSHAYFDEHIPHVAQCVEVAGQDGQGYTTMLVSDETGYKGYIAVADRVRPSSREAMTALKQQGMGALVMLTGDNEMTAQKVAAEVGVTAVRANCLPEDKVTAVAQLRHDFEHVAMVGDGINDAPALATASVGIAVGQTAQVMETADVTLMSGDLSKLPLAVRLSRAAMRTIQVNVAVSIGIKIAFLILVLLGWGSLWLAVLADVGTSLLVTLNGMRLLKRPEMA